MPSNYNFYSNPDYRNILPEIFLGRTWRTFEDAIKFTIGGWPPFEQSHAHLIYMKMFDNDKTRGHRDRKKKTRGRFFLPRAFLGGLTYVTIKLTNVIRHLYKCSNMTSSALVHLTSHPISWLCSSSTYWRWYYAHGGFQLRTPMKRR